MKIYIYSILVVCLLFSCNSNKKEEKIKVKKSEIKFKKSNECFKDSLVNDNAPKYSYKFIVDSTGYFLTSIYIYSQSKCIQKIRTKKDIESKHFELIDWNFDGYKDISVLSNCGSGGCAYWIWNYNPNSGTYEYNKELSEVLGLEMDSKQKQIIFHYRAGFQEEFWDYYKYEKSKLVFVHGVFQNRWNDTLGKSWIKKTYTKVVNNKEVITADSTMED